MDLDMFIKTRDMMSDYQAKNSINLEDLISYYNTAINQFILLGNLKGDITVKLKSCTKVFLDRSDDYKADFLLNMVKIEKGL